MYLVTLIVKIVLVIIKFALSVRVALQNLMEVALHVMLLVFNVVIQILIFVHCAMNHYFTYLMVNASNAQTIAFHAKMKQLVNCAI